MNDFLACHGVCKQFGEQQVLDAVDLQVARGECLVLLGPSGCGKSTLLNLISGMLAADGGRLLCDGQVLDDPQAGVHVPMQRRGFGMVFQDFSLWPHMRVFDNVAFGLRMQGVRRGERRQRVVEVLRQVQMEGFADRLPGELSGGQQQRVAIARALAVRPRLLLLDEPLSALDARLREDLQHELSRLLGESDVTAIYVTHDQQEAFTLGDRIALMAAGRLVQVGSPEALYREPANRFVAGFIGHSNLLAYQRCNGHLVLEGDLSVALTADDAPEAGHCLLRRESITVEAPDEALPFQGVSLRATCESTHFLGDREEALVRLDNGLQLRGFARGKLRQGQTVRVRFPREAAQFLAE